MGFLLVCLGAAAGAPVRYLVDRAISARHDSLFPWGTFAVNVAGSFLLGLITGLGAPERLMLLFGTGFCGSLTTYSTFSYETLRLAEDGAWMYAGLNVAASVVASVAAAVVGYLIGSSSGG